MQNNKKSTKQKPVKDELHYSREPLYHRLLTKGEALSLEKKVLVSHALAIGILMNGELQRNSSLQSLSATFSPCLEEQWKAEMLISIDLMVGV